ncbi:hypothetical protein EPN44_13540 [bacterium]|nr:MAG: hypothetical protein EPN44_13540 [bacterium]
MTGHGGAEMWSEERSDRSLLTWLLQPYTVEEFASTYYERAPLVIERRSPDHFQSYFSLREMERVLYGAELESDDMRVVKDGVLVRADTYLRGSARSERDDQRLPPATCIDADRVSALFAHGCTVVLDRVQSYSSSVLRLCRGLEAFFRHRVNTNLYLTPASSQGFAAHYDTHDTVLLQVEGSKLWRIYGSEVELPLVAQKHDKKRHPSGEVQIEVELHPGDLLYLPRGVMHEGKCTGEISLHLTLGLHPVLWTDVLERAAKLAGLGEVSLRRTAFEPALSGGGQEEALLGAIQQAFTPENLLKTLEEMRSQWVAGRRNVLDGQLQQLVNLSALSERSCIAIREHMLYELREDEVSTQLLFSGKVVKLPRGAAAVIRELASTSSLEVAALTKHDPGALAVARRLIEEGFATQLEPSGLDAARGSAVA